MQKHHQSLDFPGPEKRNKPFTEYPIPQQDRYPVILLRWLPCNQSRTCDQCGQYIYGEQSVLSECPVCGRWLCGECMDNEELCPDCMRLSEEDRRLVNAFRQDLRNT